MARSLTVPVVVSMTLSGVSELADGELGLLRAVEHPHFERGARLAGAGAPGGSASSGMVKITEIGCTWMMTQMLVASPIVT